MTRAECGSNLRAMNKKKSGILHIFNDPKFSKSFFEFLLKHDVDLGSHRLFHYRTNRSDYPDFGMQANYAQNFFSPIGNLLMLKQLFKTDRIIIHCLASPLLLLYLFLFPGLRAKCFWIIWGKDLYFYKMLPRTFFYHRVYEFFRRHVIRQIPNIITDNVGDFELAKEWYGVNARLFRSFSYPSNLYKDSPLVDDAHETTLILVGNSADPSNNHMAAFALLEKYKDDNIEIVVPLSYGGKKHARKVIEAGRTMFGAKFTALEDLIPLAEYQRLQARIDIAIFSHKRQQAMGNIITLLGMGKKVFIRRDISTWHSLKSYGLNVYDIDEFDLTALSTQMKQQNRLIIKEIYSEEKLIKQWREILAADL